MNIHIFGCGALGSNIALNIAFDAKENRLVLYDKDKVEARNIQFGTQFYRREQIGKSKASALQFNLWEMTEKTDIDVSVADIRTALIGPFPPTEENLFIDCLDNYEARNYLRKVAQGLKMPLLHVGFSPQFTFEISWDEHYTVPTDILGDFDICTMPGARSFVTYVSGLASNAVTEYLRGSERQDYIGGRFNITKLI